MEVHHFSSLPRCGFARAEENVDLEVLVLSFCGIWIVSLAFLSFAIFFSENPLDSASKAKVSNDGTLSINDVQEEDAGDFSCLVENDFGKDRITYSIIVLGLLIFSQKISIPIIKKKVFFKFSTKKKYSLCSATFSSNSGSGVYHRRINEISVENPFQQNV